MPRSREREREFFIGNLLVRVYFIIVMIRWTGLLQELASERAGLVSQYAQEHMLTPLLRAMLHKLLKV